MRKFGFAKVASKYQRPFLSPGVFSFRSVPKISTRPGPTARLPGAGGRRVPLRLGVQRGRELADLAQRLRGDRPGDEQTAGGGGWR